MLQVGHLERFNPAILAAEPLLAAPRFIECQRLAPFRERGTDVDVVLDLMIHDIDLLQMIVGSPVAALDAIGTPVFSAEIDIANARLRFDNGCVANVTASRVSLKTERKLRVFCDDAYLSIDLQQKILTVIRKRLPRRTALERRGAAVADGSRRGTAGADRGAKLRAGRCAAARRSRRSWPRCAASGRVMVSGEDGLRALRTAIAITARVRGAATAAAPCRPPRRPGGAAVMSAD